MKHFFIILFSFGVLLLSAQSKYKTHTVQKGETVYGISKKYGMTPEQVYELNPNFKNDGIKEGDIVVIPFDAHSVKTNSRIDSNYIMHQVQPKETIYGLSKRYGISIEEIIAENPEVENGLKIGSVVFIPKNIKKPVEKTPEIEIEEGYKIVLVNAQETVYGLCKIYGLSEIEFYELNPNVKEIGLKIGEQIKVPDLDAEKNNGNNNTVADESKPDSDWDKNTTTKKKPSFYLYLIKEGDTLEVVAKKHGISTEKLLKLNPEIQSELVVGRYIILPQVDDNNSAVAEVNEKFTWISTREIVENKIKILLILPFYLYANDTIADNYANPEKAPVYWKSKVSIEYYQGFKQAMDTLAALGLEIEVKVIDSDNDIERIKRQKQKIDNFNPHFIVGPLHAKNAEWLAAQYSEIPVISPLSSVTNNTNVNNLVSCHTGIKGEWLGLADIINNDFIDYRVIFASPNTEQNREAVELIKKNIAASETPNLVELWQGDGFPTLGFYKAHVNDSAQKTLWVVTSNDEAFLNDFMTKMYSLKVSNMKILTTSRVLNTRTIQKQYLSALNILATKQDFIDYNSEETEIFIKKYRAACGTEPTEFAFKGYDAGIYFTLLAARFGGIPLDRSWPSYQGLGGGFKFIEAKEDGPTNKFINVLEIVDFSLVRAEF